MTRPPLLVALRALTAVAPLVALACAPPGPAPAIAAHSAVLPLSGPCPVDGSGVEFTTEVSQLRLTVAGDDIIVPVVTEGSLGALTAEAVPVGANRTVGLFGLIGRAPLWRGVARGVTVERDVDTTVDVLLAKVGDLTCSRGGDADKRAFHTATVLDDGTILVVGGAKTSTTQDSICVGCRRLEATSSASLYNPQTGAFTPVGPLGVPRLFHTATKLSDGRVVIMGGAGSALVEDPATHPFPILPTAAVADVEVYDPASKTFRVVAADPAGGRVFAAASRTLNDEVIITGGIPGPVQARNDLSNALSSTTICGGEVVSCRAGPAMLSRRAGHAAFTVDPDGVFIIGGSIDDFRVEALRTGAGFEALEVASMTPARNVFFAATSQYVPFRLLIAGGLARGTDGGFALARTANGGGPVIVYDLGGQGQFGGIVTGEPPNANPMQTQSPRFFGTAAPLPDETRAIIAGGFADLSFTPSDELEKYEQTTLLVEPLFVQGEPRVLRQARGGLVAAANGDGSIVFFGGEAPDQSGRGPIATAEIFGDPVTPPGVAE